MKTKITTLISLTLVAALLVAFIPTASVSADSLTGRGGPGGSQGQGHGNRHDRRWPGVDPAHSFRSD